MISSRPIGKLLVHRRSQGAAMGTLDGFFIMRTFGETTPEDIYATVECHRIILAERPQGSLAIVAVDPTTSVPSEAVRRAAGEITKKTAGHILGHVVIFLGDGFWASAFRSALGTMNSLNRTTYPKTVLRHEEDGVDWAIETLGESKPKYRAALLSGLDELRAGSVEPKPVNTLRWRA
jgi:hypothetical protein